MKNDFAFNLINQIPTREEHENFINLANREEIDKIGQLADYLKRQKYKYTKIYLKDGIPENLRTYINSLGIKEEDFPEGIPTTIKAYMKEKEIEEPDFKDTILNKLELFKCTFTNQDVQMNYQKKLDYFIGLKLELSTHVLPAIKAVKDESIYDDATPLDDLEDWLKSNLRVLVFDLEDPFVKLKESLLWKRYPKKGLSFEEKIALELVQFSKNHGLAKIGVCDNCQRYFLWNKKDAKYCSDSCKTRKSRNKKKSKGSK